ncbi:BsuPI-related putative proteinase inhibitor [Pseudoneobacillus sp. C159]
MNKIPFMILSSVMIASLLAGCGANQKTNGAADQGNNAPVEEKVGVEEAILGNVKVSEENGKIHIRYEAKNISKQTQNLTFQSGMKVDYILYDQEGKEVDRYSKNAIATMALEEVALDAQEAISEEFVIDNLPNGHYSMEVFLNEKDQNGKEVVSFDVTESIYNRVVGTLTGRIDLHSVEIMMDGVPKAFQLTDFAQEQLMTLEDGVEVEFIYTDTGIEQATIEKLIMAPTTVNLNKSILEVDSELAGVQERIRTTKSLEVMAGYQPLDVFSLYMYTRAGEDYETLYYFHNIDEDNLPVDKYVAENRTDDATAENRDFMKKLNEVREFQVNRIDSTRANINFKLPGSDEILEFKLIKGEDNIWRALWLPLQ